MMTVAIIETVHFQYGLTVAELFEQEDKIFFVTQEMHDRMHSYAPDLCKGQFVIIGSVGEAYKRIIEICNHEPVDLLFLAQPHGEAQRHEPVERQPAAVASNRHGADFYHPSSVLATGR